MKPTILFQAAFAICLLAANIPTNAQIVNGSFEDTTSPYFLNSQNPYSDQYPGYNNFPTVVMFNGWESASHQGGIKYHEISTAGYTGTDGSYFIRVDDSGAALESLNPVTTIAADTTYTLTLALNASTGVADSSFQLLATSQAPDTNTYHYSPTGNGYVPTTSPNPVITTLGTLAGSSPISAGATTATAFQDYTISFDTIGGDNSAYIGDNLSVLINLGAGAAVDNVRLTIASVPEPATWALMLAGVASLLVLVRRKPYARA